MKRILFFLVALALLPLAVKSQTHYVPHIWVGAHGGMSMSNISFSPNVKQSFGEGFTGGISFRYAEERHVGILAEINVVQRGWKENFEEHPLEYQRQLTYVSVPIMTHIFFGSRIVKCVINLGPELGYMIGESISSNFDYRNPYSVSGFPGNRMTEQMWTSVKNKFDYGITAGIGGEFRIGKRHAVYLEARYYFGLGNIYPASKKDTFSASRNSTIAVTGGYFFRLK